MHDAFLGSVILISMYDIHRHGLGGFVLQVPA